MTYIATELKMKQIMDREFRFCECGLIKGHKGRCLSIKLGKIRERIGRYSGRSRSPNRFNDYK